MWFTSTNLSVPERLYKTVNGTSNASLWSFADKKVVIKHLSAMDFYKSKCGEFGQIHELAGAKKYFIIYWSINN